MVLWLGCTVQTSIDSPTVTVPPPIALHNLVAESSLTHPQWAWTVDGQETAHTGPIVPARDLWPGQRWTVTAAETNQTVSTTVVIPTPTSTSVLFVVLDDIGIDRLALFGLAPSPVATPNLDALAAEGVTFDRAWANPTCTPTRASILTGRHARRTGAGVLIDMSADAWALSESEWTLPKAIGLSRAAQWRTAAVGKWHLAGPLAPNWLTHPNRLGFSHFSGSPGYLVVNQRQDVDGYFRWEKNTNGVLAISDTYNTTDIVNDTLDLVSTLPEPFFVYVAFNAAHEPLHVPPAALSSLDVTDDSSDSDLSNAVTAAFDAEFGRLVEGFSPDLRSRMTIVVVGDNGTPESVMDPAHFDTDQAKGTIHEGGVRVPLVIAGPMVEAPGRRSDALVHVVDLYPTLLDLAAVPVETNPSGHAAVDPGDGSQRSLDGESLLPLLIDSSAKLERSIGYTEKFSPNGPAPWNSWARAVRDEAYKLERFEDGKENLHHFVDGGLDEGSDLLDEPLSDADLIAYERLVAAFDFWDAALVYEGD